MRGELKERLSTAGLSDPISWHDTPDARLKEIVSIDCFDSDLFYRRMRQKNTWSRLIIAHITLEKISLEFLKQEMPNHRAIKLPRLALKPKIDLLFALGRIDKRLFDQISYVNSIRNSAAHDYDFSIPVDFQRRLQSLFPKGFWEEVGKPPHINNMLVVIVAFFENIRQESEFRWLKKNGALANARRVLDSISEKGITIDTARSSILKIPDN